MNYRIDVFFYFNFLIAILILFRTVGDAGRKCLSSSF